MTRKKYIKLLQSVGIQRNKAQAVAATHLAKYGSYSKAKEEEKYFFTGASFQWGARVGVRKFARSMRSFARSCTEALAGIESLRGAIERAAEREAENAAESRAVICGERSPHNVYKNTWAAFDELRGMAEEAEE